MSRPNHKAEKAQSTSFFPPQRARQHRPLKTRILIVGEGQKTEPEYFRKLRDEPAVREHFAITVKGGHGISQERVVEEAIAHKRNRSESYDEVWCVLDVEGPSKAESLKIACELAVKNQIILWLSNPCMEVWFLLHLVKQARPYNDGDAAKAELQRHWQSHFKRDYEKNDANVYDRLRPHMDTAVENARWVLEVHHECDKSIECNSSTDLHRLVRLLMPAPSR